MPGESNSRGYGPSIKAHQRLYFDGDERKFELWHVKFMGYLKLRGLSDTAINDPPTVSATGADATVVAAAAAAFAADAEKNAEVYAELIQLLDDRSLSLIIRDASEDGRKALHILREHYMSKGKPRIVTLWTELSNLTKENRESVTDYIIRAENAVSALRNAGETVSDSLLIAMVLKGLPHMYKPFEVVVTQRHEVQTFSEFKVALRNYEDTENSRGAREQDSVKHLKFNKFQRKGHNSNNGGGDSSRNNGGGDSSRGNEDGIVCYHCGVPGHKANVCNKKGKRWCKNCKNNTHYTNKCKKGPSNQDGNFTSTNAAQMRDGGEHSFQFMMRSQIDTDDNNSCETFNSDSVFLVDSGATRHCIVDDSKFIGIDSNFQPHSHTIELADGTVVSGIAEKKGTIELSLKASDGSIVTGTLDNVLYVPSYPQNIFSVKGALEKKSSVHFYSDKPSYLQTPDGMIFYLSKSNNGLYYLQTLTETEGGDQPQPNNNNNSDLLCVTRTIEKWHQVFGHCNCNDIMSLESVVDGMKITGGSSKFVCETCQLGKMSQQFSRTPDERSKVPLEFVHTDLSGKIDPISIDGHQYTISFTDDYSGYVFTYFLKYKSDAYKALEKFLADSAPCGTVKRMRLDNGGEFIGKQFKEVMIKNKIKQEPSCPDSPHQNGTAERWWRTCFSMARCLLIESGLPKSLWSYAVQYSTHLRNRCFQKRTGQTPYFLLLNRIPNVSKLAIFGSICYAFDHNKPKKLDDRSKKGVFCGMDKDSPAYLVYFPDEDKIRKYRTVKCTDELFEYKVPEAEPTPVDSEDDDFDFFVARHPTSIPEPVIPVANVPDQNEHDVDNNNIDNNNIDNNNIDNNDNPNNNNNNDNDNIDADEHVQDDAQLMGGQGRYPARVRRPPPRLNDYDTSTSEMHDQLNVNVDYCYSASTTHIPKTYKQAVESADADKWKAAMDAEIQALNDNNTYTLVSLPPDKKAVGGRWVYTVKSHPDGSDLFKARYVARGYTQVHGSDYFETFAPTAKMTSIRMLIQYAAQNNMLIHQLDVKTAYLNAPIDCEIYMHQPEGYVASGKESLVCKLLKSLYGLAKWPELEYLTYFCLKSE